MPPLLARPRARRFGAGGAVLAGRLYVSEPSLIGAGEVKPLLVPAAPAGRSLLCAVGAGPPHHGVRRVGVPICVATSGASAPRLEALSGIASPVVPTGTTRLRPRPGGNSISSGGGRRCLLAPAELGIVGPHAVQDAGELAR